jgi:hypothetical protein
MKRLHMPKSAATAALLAVLLLSSSITYCYGAEPLFGPSWLKVGTYVEYEGDAFVIDFLNGTMTFLGDDATGVFRWECIDLNENIAKLNVSLKAGDENSSIYFSTEVNVDTISRDVFFLNGTLIGTTHLWIHANPEEGKEIVLWNLPPDRITAKADRTAFYRTPQGVQKVIFLEGNGSISKEDNSIDFFGNGGGQMIIHAMFDLDTGVMLHTILMNEATTFALGLDQLFAIELTKTNINLGPRELMFDLRALIPYLAVAAALVTIFVTIYLRRRKNKKRANAASQN